MVVRRRAMSQYMQRELLPPNSWFSLQTLSFVAWFRGLICGYAYMLGSLEYFVFVCVIWKARWCAWGLDQHLTATTTWVKIDTSLTEFVSIGRDVHFPSNHFLHSFDPCNKWCGFGGLPATKCWLLMACSWFSCREFIWKKTFEPVPSTSVLETFNRLDSCSPRLSLHSAMVQDSRVLLGPRACLKSTWYN